MSDRKYTVKRGSSVRLELPAKDSADTAEGDDGRRRSLIVGDDDAAGYVFRPGGITFYDLGTRLHDGAYAYHLHAAPTAIGADYSLYLAGDPLGSTEGHANCLKLPYVSEFLYLDAVLKKSGAEERRYVVGRNNTRAFLKDMPSAPVDDSKAAWKSPGALVLPAFGPGWGLAVESAVYYATFDTSDTSACKVTRLPNPEAERVEFTVPASGKLRVFLRPSYARSFLYQNFFAAMLTGMGRLPVLPDFSLQREPLALNSAMEGRFSVVATPELSAAVRALYATLPPAEPFGFGGDTPPFTLDQAQTFVGETSALVEVDTNAITLLAIIDAGKDVFYVWQQIEGRLPWEMVALDLSSGAE